MLSHFDQMACSSASLLNEAGSAMEVPASEVTESLENIESGVEVFDPWLGGWSVTSVEFTRALEE